MAENGKIIDIVALDGQQRLVINGLEVDEPRLVELVGRTPEEERAQLIRDVLTVGVRAWDQASRAAEVARVEELLEQLDRGAADVAEGFHEQLGERTDKFAEEISSLFTDEDSPIRQRLEGVAELFDRNEDGNALERLQKVIEETATELFEKQNEQLFRRMRSQLDLDDRDSPLHRLRKQLHELTTSVGKLREEVAGEQARADEFELSTRKGVRFEEIVEAQLGDLLAGTADLVENVATQDGTEGTKKGDLVWTVGLPGSPRVVFECRDQQAKPSSRKIRQDLEAAAANRNAHVGIYVVDDEDKVPGRQPFEFLDEAKMVVAVDKADPRPAALRLLTLWARTKAAEVLVRQTGTDAADVTEDLHEVQRLLAEARDRFSGFREIKKHHTGIETSLTRAQEWASRVEEDLGSILEAALSLLADALSTDDPGDEAA